ncbi:putative transcriptional regulatory protein PHO23 [Glarea lozoyensis 74030]|uniref:Putative transcriptional regulatory protein PHO23 n=1 Tax=Glarea lozoyensis (strain ATCC 74030 / MF5533) TaxID=1104152 RepID=H0EWM0_GLAL7|nr:putative transcriptional regulatory protein PHO23 [Glarea lozoyensis 74030]
MLVSLDEKNHVISTAAEALTKQLARIDDCFPYIELEISDEARYGSTTHWAYPENRTGKAVASNIPRREAAAVNTLSAAAQQLAEEAAARSDARKQALLAKKNHKQAPGESDFDETNENRQKESKKSHAKVRKAADASLGVGLGITTAPGTNGNAPKRRKVEKGPTGGVVMERALSGVFGNNGTATKGKAASPRETPGPDAAKKKPRTINGTSSRKRNNTVTAAMSPSIASSPIRTTFPDPKALESVASIKPNGIAAIIPDPPVAAATTSKILPEVRLSLKELANGKVEHVLEDSTQTQPTISSGSVISSRKDSVTKKEDTEAIEDDTSSNVPDDDEEDEPGPDEPRYCYCNGVSYGEMVACDADDCKKEWFHLECAGLKVAPRGNAKWYCDECKDRVKSKRLNAR